MRRSIGPELRKLWQRLSTWPLGRWLFSRLLGLRVPYTGTLGATVETLEPGHCVVVLDERRRVRNHLHSIHAMALSNLGEMATGLALLNGLPDATRAILAGFHIQFLKKAHGQLRARSRCEVPENNARRKITVQGEIRDADGDVVATISADWLIGPEK